MIALDDRLSAFWVEETVFVLYHCCNETKRPRMFGAVVSAWYIGTTEDAIPTLMPAMTLPTTNMPRFWLAAWRVAPMIQMMALRMIVRFRPSWSARTVTASAPTRLPAGWKDEG